MVAESLIDQQAQRVYNEGVNSALHARVLVLNRLWQAVHIVDARRAVVLLCLGHARVLHPGVDNDWQVWPAEDWLMLAQNQPGGARDHYLYTVRQRVRVPKIVLLNGYGELPMKEVRLSRQSIFERDRYCCQYCGKHGRPQELNLDHVIPKDRGGMMSWTNIVTSCIRCNTVKANRTPAEARMSLLKKPRQPKSRPFVTTVVGKDVEEEWMNFLESSHDTTDVEIVGANVLPLRQEVSAG